MVEDNKGQGFIGDIINKIEKKVDEIRCMIIIKNF